MQFHVSQSGRACLVDWNAPLTVSDLLALLQNLKRAPALAGTQVVLILVVRDAVPVPPNYLLSSLQAILPAILDSSHELVSVVEGAGAERTPFRSAFRATRSLTRSRAPQMFETLSRAFAHAQRFAPHDVLELQRLLLRDSLPSIGQRT